MGPRTSCAVGLALAASIGGGLPSSLGIAWSCVENAPAAAPSSPQGPAVAQRAPHTRSEEPRASAAPPAPGPSAERDAGSPAPPPADGDEAVEISASAPRLVFRDLHTGMLPGKATRRTWTLIRDGATWVLSVRVEQGANGRLDGSERVESRWTPDSEATYRGRAQGAAGVELIRVLGEVPALPARLELACKAAKVATVAARAVLLGGDACGNGGPKPRWKPPERVPVTALLCSLGASVSAFDAELAFAPAPGVEWAFENSDCVVQEGAFRRRE